MSLIKKNDVKNYLSSQKRKGIHLYRPVSQPDATGFSGDQPAPSEIKSDAVEKTAPAGQLKAPSTKAQLNSHSVVTLIDSKSAQA